jgi:hypothetical protein
LSILVPGTSTLPNEAPRHRSTPCANMTMHDDCNRIADAESCIFVFVLVPWVLVSCFLFFVVISCEWAATAIRHSTSVLCPVVPGRHVFRISYFIPGTKIAVVYCPIMSNGQWPMAGVHPPPRVIVKCTYLYQVPGTSYT